MRAPNRVFRVKYSMIRINKVFILYNIVTRHVQIYSTFVNSYSAYMEKLGDRGLENQGMHYPCTHTVSPRLILRWKFCGRARFLEQPLICLFVTSGDCVHIAETTLHDLVCISPPPQAVPALPSAFVSQPWALSNWRVTVDTWRPPGSWRPHVKRLPILLYKFNYFVRKSSSKPMSGKATVKGIKKFHLKTGCVLICHCSDKHNSILFRCLLIPRTNLRVSLRHAGIHDVDRPVDGGVQSGRSWSMRKSSRTIAKSDKSYTTHASIRISWLLFIVMIKNFYFENRLFTWL